MKTNNSEDSLFIKSLVLLIVLAYMIITGLSCSTVHKTETSKFQSTDSAKSSRLDTSSKSEQTQIEKLLKLKGVHIRIEYNNDSANTGSLYNPAVNSLPGIIKGISGNKTPKSINIDIDDVSDSLSVKHKSDSTGKSKSDSTVSNKKTIEQDKNLSRKKTPLWLTISYIGAAILLILFLIYKIKKHVPF